MLNTEEYEEGTSKCFQRFSKLCTWNMDEIK